jgi:hypothetical protein
LYGELTEELNVRFEMQDYELFVMNENIKSHLQPLNVSVHKVFKAYLRKK